MTQKKKRSKSKTPARRRSTRDRKRSQKGKDYDDYLICNSSDPESDTITAGSIGNDLPGSVVQINRKIIKETHCSLLEPTEQADNVTWAVLNNIYILNQHSADFSLISLLAHKIRSSS